MDLGPVGERSDRRFGRLQLFKLGLKILPLRGQPVQRAGLELTGHRQNGRCTDTENQQQNADRFPRKIGKHRSGGFPRRVGKKINPNQLPPALRRLEPESTSRTASPTATPRLVFIDSKFSEFSAAPSPATGSHSSVGISDAA